MHPGRRFWYLISVEGLDPYFVGPFILVNFMKFLPAGISEKDGHIIDRKRSLIQVYTDPGGIRTIAASDIRFQDPGRKGR